MWQWKEVQEMLSQEKVIPKIFFKLRKTMKKTFIKFVLLMLLSPSIALSDECFEGDCENGLGKGFTEEGHVYEGQWLDGEPHGRGKLFISRDKVLDGEFKNGEFVEDGS